MRTNSPRYIGVADTAKLLRAALKAEFPGVKFSVRSQTYSGGASIRVGWLDGPTTRQVDAVCNRYKAADFDGMIDMESGRYHWLTPQGEVYVAEIRGTEGSRGTIASAEYIKPHDDAELVSLAGKYISTTRHHSREMHERAAQWAEETWGERPRIVEKESWKGGGKTYCYFEAENPSAANTRFPGGPWDTIADIANREMWQQPGPRHSDRSE